MLRIEPRTALDAWTLEEIFVFLDAARALRGRAPLGEHKVSQLVAGADGWLGLFAYDRERLVGYAHTRWNAPGTVPRVAVEVVVARVEHGQQVARRLLDEARAVLGRSGGGLLHLWVHWVIDPHDTLAARMGLRIERELAFMARPLDAPPPVALPPGVTLRGYRHPDDEAAFLAANNAAFAGHPENGGWGPDDFAERRALEWFDPAGLLLAWRGAELLGFHWTKRYGDGVGEVYVLGLAPQAQGLGLGRALLHAGLAHLYGHGCRRVVLYVDRASEPARRLYESEGFATESLEVCYAEDVRPVADQASSVAPWGSSL